MSEPHTQVPRDTPPIPVPRSLRIGSFLLSSLLTVLVVWLLGFVLNDIGNIDGPNYPSVANEFIDGSLRQRSQELRSEIGAIETRIAAAAGAASRPGSAAWTTRAKRCSK